MNEQASEKVSREKYSLLIKALYRKLTSLVWGH